MSRPANKVLAAALGCGMLDPAAARAAGVTRNAATIARRAAGIPSPWIIRRRAREEQVRQMNANGLTDAAIATVIGTAASTVSKIRHALGLPRVLRRA